ncbi:MAG: exodeoxyribonuclease VII large subunit, partial [Thermodesulfobacteriota bacterium]
GRVSLYEKRGEYQLILEVIEPKGIGALQLAFLQLKERLEKEGLFDPSHKKPIPFLPQTIGIVTSPTGAVIQDMIQIIHRRFENVRLLLYPVRVQGEEAPQEIVEAIEYFNSRKDVDVIIVGRGGGSFEDLWSFNEERVARAIYRSRIPIISAVGHETDYTISDFVADLRAPTPSAAAELVVRDKKELMNTLQYLITRLETQMLQHIEDLKADLSSLQKGLIDPKKRVEMDFKKVRELSSRVFLLTTWMVKNRREEFSHINDRLYLKNPAKLLEDFKLLIIEEKRELTQNLRHILQIKKQQILGVVGKLDSLSPLSILQRGYSITRKLPSLKILRRSSDIERGDKVEVTLHEGSLLCGVEETKKA